MGIGNGLVEQIQDVRETKPVLVPQTTRVAYRPRTTSGVIMTPDRSLTVSAVWACIRYISQSIAKMPWEIIKKSEGRTEVQDKHPLQYVLNERPSSECSSMQFRETLTSWALRWGNGYAEIERSLDGRPLRLWPLEPWRVTVMRDRVTSEIYYEVGSNAGGGTVQFGQMDVFHLRGYGEGVVGLNIMAYAAQSLGWVKAAQLFGAGFFGHGAQLAGVVSMKKSLSPEALQELQEDFQKLYGGAAKGGNVAFLDNEMTYQSIGIEPEKGQFLETNEFLVTEVCRWFGVPPHKIYDLRRATFCVPADVVVTTADGPKYVCDVEEGDLVWSVGEGGEHALKPVLKSGLTGRSRILTFRTRDRVLRCNAQHRVMVRREFWNPDKKAKGKYTVVDGVRCQKDWRNEYVPAGEIRVGDRLVVLDELPEQSGTSSPTREVDVEFMEMLGHLIGDGFYIKGYRSKNLTTFGISHSEDNSYTQHYVSVIERCFENVERFDHGRPAGKLTAVRRDKNTTVFYSVAACEELRLCGVVGTAKTKRVPAWIFRLKREFQGAFLRGYLDADGTVSKRGYTRFVSASSDLLEDVRQLCVQLGVRCSRVFGTERSSSFEGYESTKTMLYGLACSNAREVLERIGSNDLFRLDRLKNLAKNMQTREVEIYDNEKLRRFAGEGLRPSTVLSIEISEDEEDVYDLTVADNHCFIGNGVVLHNSNIEHQSIETVEDTLRPWCRRFEDEANFKLFGQNRQGLSTRIDTSRILRADTAARIAYYTGMRNNGAMNADEIREEEGLNPIGQAGGGKKYTMQSGFTTLDKVGEEPAPAPAPAVPAEPEPEPEPTDAEKQEQQRVQENLQRITRLRNRVFAREHIGEFREMVAA